MCKHGRQKAKCGECGGKSICVHGKQKFRCRDCGGNGLCTLHGTYHEKCTVPECVTESNTWHRKFPRTALDSSSPAGVLGVLGERQNTLCLYQWQRSESVQSGGPRAAASSCACSSQCTSSGPAPAPAVVLSASGLVPALPTGPPSLAPTQVQQDSSFVKWLCTLGLPPHVVDLLQAEELTLNIMHKITADDLIALGVRLGPRTVILTAAAQLPRPDCS